MHVVVAWFARNPSPAWRAGALRRLDAALAPLLPDTYQRIDRGDDGWQLTVAHSPRGLWRWPTYAQEGTTTAVSLGVPVGPRSAEGPVALAGRLLDREDVHADVVPPFALMALSLPAGPGRRFVAQQDWLGMCRLFLAERGGVTVLSSRPSLAAEVLGATVRPDLDGWESYVSCGHFAGETSPIAGVRLLRAGERVSARPLAAGGWTVRTEVRHNVADLAAEGAAATAPTGEVVDTAAHSLAATATALADLYEGEVTLGLSGGRDSRLLAASFIAGGIVPALNTNDDTSAEGETARELVRRLRATRGLDPSHKVVSAGAPAAVHQVGLRERLHRMQLRHDYQFPSTYLVRPAGPPRLPHWPDSLSVTGAGGEIVTGYWYPSDDDAIEQTALARLAPLPRDAATEEVRVRQRHRVLRMLDDAAATGLSGPALLDYAYLVERARRWATSAYAVGMVTPFLTPAVVRAAFALTPQQKREKLLHTSLIARFVPEWADVPFVSSKSGPSTATRIWDGDGLPVVHRLWDTTHGDLIRLIDRATVAVAIRRCAGGKGARHEAKVLEQFAWLAAASQRLEPAGVTEARTTYDAFLARDPTATRPVPPAVKRVAIRLRFVRRSPVGERIWQATRRRLTAPAGDDATDG